jgi:hypothetical protein
MIEKETYMKTIKLAMGFVGVLLLTASAVLAEDKTPPPDVPLRMTVVFNEYDGSKKIASLPYLMPCKASVHRDNSSLKMGIRVPFKQKPDETYYQDVGTQIDCEASPADDRGGFTVNLGVKHNTVFSASQSPDRPAEWHPGEPQSDHPIFGGVEANLKDLLIHDGQTVEAMTATDPVSGHVWKVEVTLNVVK